MQQTVENPGWILHTHKKKIQRLHIMFGRVKIKDKVKIHHQGKPWEEWGWGLKRTVCLFRSYNSKSHHTRMRQGKQKQSIKGKLEIKFRWNIKLTHFKKRPGLHPNEVEWRLMVLINRQSLITWGGVSFSRTRHKSHIGREWMEWKNVDGSLER